MSRWDNVSLEKRERSTVSDIMLSWRQIEKQFVEITKEYLRKLFEFLANSTIDREDQIFSY